MLLKDNGKLCFYMFGGHGYCGFGKNIAIKNLKEGDIVMISDGDWILGNKKVDYIRGKSKYPMATYKIIHTYIAKDKKHRVVVEEVEE